jgi:pimeloyl-ACP methyl ester carboxylesterase
VTASTQHLARAHSSTNGRAFSLRLARAAFAALSGISPGLAARAGETLFLTPPPPARPERERRELAAWRRFEVDTETGRLAAWRTGHGPAVLLAHGWGGRGGQLAAFGPALAEAGCSAVTFDAPAHGESPGRHASVALFARTISAVARAVGAQAVVGHSLGGAATALAVTRGLSVRAAVLIGTPPSPASFFEAFGDEMRLGAAVRAAMQARIERRVGARFEDLDLPTVARRQPRLPMLVVHDRGDREVPFTSAAAIAGSWPGARLLGTTGLGHRRILRDEGVIRDSTSFVTDHLARCACGRLATEGLAAETAEPRCAGCSVADDLWSRPARQARLAVNRGR